DVDRLLRKVVDDGQALQPTTAIERIHDKVDRPDLAWPMRHEQRPTLDRYATAFTPTTHLQAIFAIQPVYAFDVHPDSLTPQQRMNSPVPKPTALGGQLLDTFAQLIVPSPSTRGIVQHRARQTHQYAGASL